MTTWTTEDREAIERGLEFFRQLKGENDMNANELAIYLEDITDSKESPYRQAATMLRKQAEEIEYWKEMFEKAMKEQER